VKNEKRKVKLFSISNTTKFSMYGKNQLTADPSCFNRSFKRRKIFFCQINNFLIYQSPVSKKWSPIAHDFDLTFRYPPDYSFKGLDRCVIYKKLLDEMIPIFKGKILDHVNELVKTVNSSISHPIQLNAFINFQSKLQNNLNSTMETWEFNCLHSQASNIKFWGKFIAR
jgi:hypothetical protein